MADSPNNLPGTGPGKKKIELSMEMRLLIAFILMGAVLFLTPYIYKPTPPAAQPKQATPVQAAKPAAESKPPEIAKAAAPAPIPGQMAADKEENFTIESDLYRIQFSNRGAVVKSWILKQKKYSDSKGRLLELVNQTAPKSAGLPFSLEFKGQKPPVDVNQALYVTERSSDGLGIDFKFSDGRVMVRKSFRFTMGKYLSTVETEVTQSGGQIPHLLVWRGGFGDPMVEDPATVQHTLHFDVAANKLVVNEVKAAKDGPVSVSGRFSFAGLEDHYFAVVVLPGANAPSVEAVSYSDMAPIPATGKEGPHPGVAVGGGGLNSFPLFVGPKDIDLLKKLDPKLVDLVDWGWFWFLAKPLFAALNWVNDKMTHNFGWAIILVTIAINMLLLPLRMASMKSMKKMAQIQPQIAAINAKYQGIGMRDPKKNEQNQEVMDLYKKNGVNPAGGCVPMLLQIPFFFAFYKVLTVTIELRNAPWLWVSDLSMPETLPIRILPIAMIVTQFIQQKMTPSTSPDPTQQKVMMFMPLMLGFFFYSVSSGLVLYWLMGNVIGIAQQMVFNRMTPTPAPAVIDVTPRKKGSRK